MALINKRNGNKVEFDKSKIVRAIEKAMMETDAGVDSIVSNEIASDIEYLINVSKKEYSVEDISDIVEEMLANNGRFDASKKYILYRDERKKVRKKESKYQFLSDEFLSEYKHMQDPFPTELGKIVYYRTYSRPIPEEQRRERWWETVARVCNFSAELELDALKRKRQTTEHDIFRLKKEAEEMFEYMYNLKVFPSGRSLWSGGVQSSKVSGISNFNCSFLTIDEFEKFAEMFEVLMLGTGVGISVENKYVNNLPKINLNIEIIHKDFTPVPKYERKEYTEIKVLTNNVIEIVIGDSRFAWSQAIKFYFDIITRKQYHQVEFIILNYDNVRQAGERIKTFGGFASGHSALQQMFNKINDLFMSKEDSEKSGWYKLKPIDCLDVATSIAENVVSGGTRRSAIIVYCDEDDKEVISAKNNLYYKDEKDNWVANNKIIHRMLSNNTILYKEKPTREKLKEQFKLIRYSGEPSFGNLQEMLRRRPDVQGGNPCFEILLRDRGVCNLTEVNMMEFVDENGNIDFEGLYKAQRLSAKIGYRMASIELEIHKWNVVNKEDMLIGCSLTGVMDFINKSKISDKDLKTLLKKLREIAHEESNRLADLFGTNKPKLQTCVKPSGTISQLPTVSSGVHFSHSPYYIRRVRISVNDPLAKAMKKSGFKWNPEVGQTIDNHNTAVFEFPAKAPEGKTKYDVSAIEQLELYKMFMEEYVDNNASNTIHVRDNEWEEVENWVYDNWDSIVGVTFLSLDDSFYQLMPYESITKEQYEEMLKNTPKFNPSILKEFETFEEFEIADDGCATGYCPVK